MTLYERIEAAVDAYGSNVCVGIDMPQTFNLNYAFSWADAVITATKQSVAAYKLNLAYYQVMGGDGYNLLQYIIEEIRKCSPYSVIIGDGKHGDVPHTAEVYAEMMFNELMFNACTVNPYIGIDSIEPFLFHQNRGVFAVGYTSNDGSMDFQDLHLINDTPMYRHVINECMKINEGNVGIVAGANNKSPDRTEWIAMAHPGAKILVPGIGSQGGDLEYVAGLLGRNALYSASRSIMNSCHRDNIYDTAKNEVVKMNTIINKAVQER